VKRKCQYREERKPLKQSQGLRETKTVQGTRGSGIVRKAVGKGEKPDHRERRRLIQGLREAERQIRGVKETQRQTQGDRST
jgi:hypothetical protein